MGTKPPKPMREAMPKVAAFIDALREAFGREHIDECIRRGLHEPGHCWHFRAEENGHVIEAQRGDRNR